MYQQASVAPQPKGLSACDLAFALAVALPLAAVIAPYRHVHLPQVFILSLAAVGGIWCFKAAVEDVEKLLFAFLLYVPFQKILPGDFGGMVKAFNFTNAFLLLLGIGWLTRSTMGDETERRGRSAQGIAITFFLALTSVAIAAEAVRESGAIRYAALADLKRWLTPFAIYYLVVSTARSTAAVKRMFLAVVVTTAVIGLLGVKQFWIDSGGGGRTNLEGIRIAVTSGPSNLGAFFAYYVPYILALWLANVHRFAYWALLAPLAWCLDSLRTTFSRGAALAFVAAALVVLWKRSRLAFMAAAVLAFVAIYTFGIRLPANVFGRMASTYEASRPGSAVSDKLDASSRTRLTIWGGAVEMLRDNPLFGVGYERFPQEIGRYRPAVATMDPHNNFLKIGTEMGVPALAAFVLVLAVCLWKAWGLSRRVEDPLLRAILVGYCGSVIAVLIANMFGSRLDSTEITTQFWAMTGGVVVIDRYHEAEREKARQEAADGVA
jgi:O-antigen ligase